METMRVKSVGAGKAPLTLNVIWDDGSKSAVNMTGLVHSSRHFRVFAGDPDAFKKVKVVDWGSGIEWENGLDYSAHTLRTLADEQRPMTGKDLARFQTAWKLHVVELAELFDCSARTVRDTLRFANKELPTTWAISLRVFDRDRSVFAAHYRPAEVRPRGRPKATMHH